MKRNGLNQEPNNRRPNGKQKVSFLGARPQMGKKLDKLRKKKEKATVAAFGRRPMVALPPVDVSGRRNK
jgi:hypothetical protein